MKIFISIIILFSAFNLFAADSKDATEVSISVTKRGFEPNQIAVQPGHPVILKITRKTKATCATEIQIPNLKIKKDLPLDQEVTIELGKLEKGQINFGCGMSMMEAGIINVN